MEDKKYHKSGEKIEDIIIEVLEEFNIKYK